MRDVYFMSKSSLHVAFSIKDKANMSSKSSRGDIKVAAKHCDLKKKKGHLQVCTI